MTNNVLKALKEAAMKLGQKPEEHKEFQEVDNRPSYESRTRTQIGNLMPLPDVKMEPSYSRVAESDVKKEKLNIYYPLIPKRPKKGDPIFAYAHITWNPGTHSFLYRLVEPYISPEKKDLMEKIKITLQEKLDVDFGRITSDEAEDYLNQKIDEVMAFLQIPMSDAEKEIIMYFIKRDFIGLGEIEPLMRDPYIEDISCDGFGIPVFVYHRNPIIGSTPSTILFDDKDRLDIFVQKLTQKSGKSISVAEPLIDASLPDGSRLQATLSTDIARRGSNFTIRKFTENPLSPTDLINFGAIDSRSLAYLWYCLENGKSIMVSGGTATGKTTFLNVLSMFIRPEAKIVSIEDTPELRLEHPHWVPEVAREAISSVRGKAYGSVDLFDLLKSSLRQRPDYIIVGEVRGKEAYVLFQQIATGHTGMSTVHAENMEKLIDRLTTEPINLSASLLEALDIVVFLKRVRTPNGLARKTSAIEEITGFNRKDDYPTHNKVFEWNPKKDIMESKGSYILDYISKHTGSNSDTVKNEIIDRTKLLEWMRKKKITDFRDASNIIRTYYTDKESLMRRIERDMGW